MRKESEVKTATRTKKRISPVDLFVHIKGPSSVYRSVLQETFRAVISELSLGPIRKTKLWPILAHDSQTLKAEKRSQERGQRLKDSHSPAKQLLTHCGCLNGTIDPYFSWIVSGRRVTCWHNR